MWYGTGGLETPVEYSSTSNQEFSWLKINTEPSPTPSNIYIPYTLYVHSIVYNIYWQLINPCLLYCKKAKEKEILNILKVSRRGSNWNIINFLTDYINTLKLFKNCKKKYKIFSFFSYEGRKKMVPILSLRICFNL